MILDPYGNCLSGCAANHMYYDTTSRQCYNCSNACYACDGPQASQCLSCNPPLQLFQGSCVNTCPFGFYSTSSYICKPCNLNCADCRNSSTNCSVCEGGAFLQNTPTGFVCMFTCGTGFYMNITSSVC